MSLSLVCISTILLFAIVHGLKINGYETEKLKSETVPSHVGSNMQRFKKDAIESLEEICEGCKSAVYSYALEFKMAEASKQLADFISYHRCGEALTGSRKEKCNGLLVALLPKAGKVLSNELFNSRICYETKLCYGKRALRNVVIPGQPIAQIPNKSKATGNQNDDGCAECVDVLQYFRNQLDNLTFQSELIQYTNQTLCKVFPQPNRKLACSKIILDFKFYQLRAFQWVKDNLQDLSARCDDADYCGDYSDCSIPSDVSNPYPGFSKGLENRAFRISDDYSLLTVLMHCICRIFIARKS